MELDKIKDRQKELSGLLLQKRNSDGFWTGQLSPSALGVAVALTALHFDDKLKHHSSIRQGIQWLVLHQNSDGGYGDTPQSLSNISTSLLVYAAFHRIADSSDGLSLAIEKLTMYLKISGIDINSSSVADAILNHYKTDKTFSVPILTMCALCGIPDKNAFSKIPQLPFEMALFPRSLYKLLNMSVVSYAIPALIAVGIAIFNFKPRKNRILRWLRGKAIEPALRLLGTLMPQSGGFLEAIPLTGFVSMCLIASGYEKLEVVEKGIDFLRKTQRADGSWAIDIDLSTWVTTLSIKALCRQPEDGLSLTERENLSQHLVNQQYTHIHPFNGAQPGGWGWTNHSGSVPDGDDTPGAIISLLMLNRDEPQKVKATAIAGCNWLLNLQNNDGGFPTFVRGWGKLPFDQSCADLTGHGVLALSLTLEFFINDLSPSHEKKYKKAIRRGISYLQKHQRADGALLPLWFGNQQVTCHLNPVYGTARVLTYLDDMADLKLLPDFLKKDISRVIHKGREYLRGAQNEDGSWGGDTHIPGSMEETALALGALAGRQDLEACNRAIDWLDRQYTCDGLKPSPIGLYFASLWYEEVLYPYAAYLEGINRFLQKSG